MYVSDHGRLRYELSLWKTCEKRDGLNFEALAYKRDAYNIIFSIMLVIRI